MGFRVIPVSETPSLLISWTPPASGEYKLNTDGSCIHGFYSGEGVIYETILDLIVRVFSRFYSPDTNTMGEALALLDGLRLTPIGRFG